MAKDSRCFCTASREWQRILGAFVQPAGNGKGIKNADRTLSQHHSMCIYWPQHILPDF